MLSICAKDFLMKTQSFENKNGMSKIPESVGETTSQESSKKSPVMFETKELVAKVFGPQKDDTPSFFRGVFVAFLQKLLHEKMANTFAKKYQHVTGLGYIDNLLDFFGITYTVTSSELKNIPSTGKLIIIANHMTGLQDSFSLMQLIANKRENKKVKLLMNEMMVGATGNFSWGIPVNVHGAITKSSLKQIHKCLDNDEAIIVFPAGVVNRLSFKGLKDIPWKASFLKIAKKKNAPILPIKINGRNSIFFYLLSLLVPNSISSFMLFHEFVSARKRKPLHFSIGKVVPSASFSNVEITNQEYIDMFYKHLYTLEAHKGDILKTEITIGKPKNKMILRAEVEKANFLGNTNDGKKIIIVDAVQSPFLIRELGRIREIAFRASGGGTGKSHDNDMYDNYYHHLILWDVDDLEIVGAYRLGECKQIIAEKGKEGLYTNKLCHLNDNFLKDHDRWVELGRGFVQPKYWRTRALTYLWQGLLAYFAHNPNMKYGYGMVTIDADTPPKAVAALVYYYTTFFPSPKDMIMRARTPYVLVDEDVIEFKALFSGLDSREAFVVLKKYLKTMRIVVPTLFKQYTEVFEEGAVGFQAFNVNEQWSGVVEGFIIAEIACLKPKKRKLYVEKFQKPKTEDSITGLPNNVQVSAIFGFLTKYQRKTDIDFILVIIKISNYPYIYINLGEEIWNNYLVKIAGKITNSLRCKDTVGKWKEDQFIILLRNVASEDADNIYLKLKKAIKQVRPDQSIEATCRLGNAPYIPKEIIDDTVQRAYESLQHDE